MVDHRANVLYREYRGHYLEMLRIAMRFGASAHYGWISEMLKNIDAWHKKDHFQNLILLKDKYGKPSQFDGGTGEGTKDGGVV